MRNKINDNLRNLINYIDSLKDVPGVDRTWRAYLQYAIDFDCFKEFSLNYFLLKDIYDEQIRIINEKESKKTDNNQEFYM